MIGLPLLLVQREMIPEPILKIGDHAFRLAGLVRYHRKKI